MSDLAKALPHMIMATIVITAVVILACVGKLTGSEVLPVIAAAGGFTLGGTVASGSMSAAIAGQADGSPSMSQLASLPDHTTVTATVEHPPTAN